MRYRRDHANNLQMVRLSLAFVSNFTVIGALSVSADEVLPARFNFDRYSAMLKNSPFAIATAVALPAATPDFAKDLYIANAARSPEGDMVTLMSTSDQNFKKYLNTEEPVDGFSIASIEWSDKVGDTKVTISKDGQFATLTFNQALLSQAMPAGRLAANPMPVAVPMVPSSGTVSAPRGNARGASRKNSRATAESQSNPATIPTPNPEPFQLPGQSGLLSPEQQMQQQLSQLSPQVPGQGLQSQQIQQQPNANSSRRRKLPNQ
jgi:hypothetical protein